MKQLFFLVCLILLVLPFGFSSSLWGFAPLRNNFFSLDINGEDINVSHLWASDGNIGVLGVGTLFVTNVHSVDVNSIDMNIINGLVVSGDANFVNVGVSEGVYANRYFGTGDFNIYNGTNYCSYDVSLGSFACGGELTSATGGKSVAFGQWSQALNSYSGVLYGFGSVASGDNAVAGGNGCEASSNYAIAFGDTCTASGQGAVSLGSVNTAGANYATAIGYVNTANGTGSTALGYSNGAYGNYSFVVGKDSRAYGVASSAIGEGVSCFKDNQLCVQDLNVLGDANITNMTISGVTFFGDTNVTNIGVSGNSYLNNLYLNQKDILDVSDILFRTTTHYADIQNVVGLLWSHTETGFSWSDNGESYGITLIPTDNGYLIPDLGSVSNMSLGKATNKWKDLFLSGKANVQDLNAFQDVNAGRAISAPIYFGDGSKLTGIASGTDTNFQTTADFNSRYVSQFGDTNVTNIGVSGNSFLWNTDVNELTLYAAKNNPMRFEDRGGGYLSLRTITPGKFNIFSLTTADADNTDYALFATAGRGLIGMNSDYEGLLMGYTANALKYQIFTSANGTGYEVRPLYIYTGANLSQLVLNTNGTTNFGSTVYAPSFSGDVSGDLYGSVYGSTGEFFDVFSDYASITDLDVGTSGLYSEGNILIDNNIQTNYDMNKTATLSFRASSGVSDSTNYYYNYLLDANLAAPYIIWNGFVPDDAKLNTPISLRIVFDMNQTQPTDIIPYVYWNTRINTVCEGQVQSAGVAPYYKIELPLGLLAYTGTSVTLPLGTANPRCQVSILLYRFGSNVNDTAFGAVRAPVDTQLEYVSRRVM